jgi:hypothetical protein
LAGRNKRMLALISPFRPEEASPQVNNFDSQQPSTQRLRICRVDDFRPPAW